MEFQQVATPQSGLGQFWSGAGQPGLKVAPSGLQDAAVGPFPCCGTSMGPVLPGVMGGAPSPSERGERGASCPAYPSNPALPANPAKVTSFPETQHSVVHPAKVPANQQNSCPASPSSKTSQIGCHVVGPTETSTCPPRPQSPTENTIAIAVVNNQCKNILENASNSSELLNEDDILITGNKNLILNSVLTFTYQMTGQLSHKKLTELMSKFYPKEKLLKAYKLAYSLVPKARKLRSTPDLNAWKAPLIAQHIINIMSELKKEEVYSFASLYLDVPLCTDVRELTKPISHNSLWSFFNTKKAQTADKETQYYHQIYTQDPEDIDEEINIAIKDINSKISSKYSESMIVTRNAKQC